MKLQDKSAVGAAAGTPRNRRGRSKVRGAAGTTGRKRLRHRRPVIHLLWLCWWAGTTEPPQSGFRRGRRPRRASARHCRGPDAHARCRRRPRRRRAPAEGPSRKSTATGPPAEGGLQLGCGELADHARRLEVAEVSSVATPNTISCTSRRSGRCRRGNLHVADLTVRRARALRTVIMVVHRCSSFLVVGMRSQIVGQEPITPSRRTTSGIAGWSTDAAGEPVVDRGSIRIHMVLIASLLVHPSRSAPSW